MWGLTEQNTSVSAYEGRRYNKGPEMTIRKLTRVAIDTVMHEWQMINYSAGRGHASRVPSANVLRKYELLTNSGGQINRSVSFRTYIGYN